MGIKVYETDPKLFAERWDRLRFTVDAAASDANALVRPHRPECAWQEDVSPGLHYRCCGYIGRYYTAETDGLKHEHYVKGDRVWCNPPYDHTIAKFLKLASETRREGVAWDFLLPSSTDSRWFHTYLWDKRFNRPREGVELDFPSHRISFLLDGKPILDKAGKVQAPRHTPLFATFWPEGMGPR
jgi:hypothetical protein